MSAHAFWIADVILDDLEYSPCDNWPDAYPQPSPRQLRDHADDIDAALHGDGDEPPVDDGDTARLEAHP